MCKLCNTNREPFIPSRKGTTTSKDLYKFVEICKDYLNEVPCKSCRMAYSMYLNKRKKAKFIINPDEYIINKLFSTRIKNKVSNWNTVYRRTVEKINTYDLALKKEKLNNTKQRNTSFLLKKNITQIVYKNKIVYKVQLTCNKKYFNKTCNTLEEAEAFITINNKPTRTNKLGEKYIHKEYNRYVVRNKHCQQIGRFDTLEEAIKLRNKYIKEIENDNSSNTI